MIMKKGLWALWEKVPPHESPSLPRRGRDLAKATQLVHCRVHLRARSPVSLQARIFPSMPHCYDCAIIIMTITHNLAP